MRTPALPFTLLVLALGSVAATGCGTDGESASATTVVERVTVQADATTTEAADVTTESVPDDSGSASSEVSDDEGSSSGSKDRSEASASGSDCEEVPNVVGLRDLQLSQDTLQAAGFYFMDQEDATGQDRAQLLDRNWVVTRQSPKAGECVDTSTTITTYAKKHGE
ncbi:PASTA domain-containing protein [Patulibacter sp.]|uniref:PASTA domain-containing protein n=1 Tax=Patulibacter sp. TaxID=1912859 RepID=UPI00271E4AE7|nr:PASTA domain-containing protein [Patulibacter sp.]MDO9410063.1 PASTA domain-containing protein [Patulibacter sp.]